MGNVVDSLVSGFTDVIADIFSKPLDFLSGKTCSSACGPTWDVVCYVHNFCVASLAKTAAMLFLLYLVLLFFYLVYKLGICTCVCHVVRTIVCSFISCSFSACTNGCSIACHKMRSVWRKRRRCSRSDDIEECLSSSSSDDSEPEDGARRSSLARRSGDRRRVYLESSPYAPQKKMRSVRRKRRRCSRSDDIEECLSSSSSDDSEPEDGARRSSLARRSGDRRRVYLERSLRPRHHRVTVGVGRQYDVVEPPTVHHHGHDGVLHHHSVKVTRTSRFAHKGGGSRRGDGAKQS